MACFTSGGMETSSRPEARRQNSCRRCASLKLNIPFQKPPAPESFFTFSFSFSNLFSMISHDITSKGRLQFTLTPNEWVRPEIERNNVPKSSPTTSDKLSQLFRRCSHSIPFFTSVLWNRNLSRYIVDLKSSVVVIRLRRRFAVRTVKNCSTEYHLLVKFRTVHVRKQRDPSACFRR